MSHINRLYTFVNGQVADADQVNGEFNQLINKANSLDDDVTVLKNSLLNGGITTDKIANYAITNEKLAGGSITESKIANGAITTICMADGAVTNAKLGSDVPRILFGTSSTPPSGTYPAGTLYVQYTA
jgi:hypothetical protein